MFSISTQLNVAHFNVTIWDQIFAILIELMHTGTDDLQIQSELFTLLRLTLSLIFMLSVGGLILSIGSLLLNNGQSKEGVIPQLIFSFCGIMLVLWVAQNDGIKLFFHM
jgi:hypothetical protein